MNKNSWTFYSLQKLFFDQIKNSWTLLFSYKIHEHFLFWKFSFSETFPVYYSIFWTNFRWSVLNRKQYWNLPKKKEVKLSMFYINPNNREDAQAHIPARTPLASRASKPCCRRRARLLFPAPSLRSGSGRRARAAGSVGKLAGKGRSVFSPLSSE